MNYNSETLGCGIRYKMAEMKLKDKQVHEATGISRNSIAAHRNGKSKMVKLDTLNKLCQLLNCTPNDLFRDTPKEWHKKEPTAMDSLKNKFQINSNTERK